MRKYIDSFKRRFILFFLIPYRTLGVIIRNIKRLDRLYKIRKKKEIYDLTTMD